MKSDYTEQANPVVNLEAMTLSELSAYATSEANLAQAHASKAVEHAIACGEALLMAKSQMPVGSFGAWLESDFPLSQTIAHRWMRVAYYRHDVGGAQTLATAIMLVDGLPRLPSILPKPWVDEAKAMRDAGSTYVEIGRVLGLRPSMVRAYVDPRAKEAIEKHNRELAAARTKKRQAERALAAEIRRKEIAHLAAQRDDATSKLYSLIRQALPLAEAARDAAVTPEQRDRFDAVVRAQRRSEDQIGEALRAERGESWGAP